MGVPLRYHSLDAARAVMMLLGLVLHSAASFTTVPLGDAWPYQDLNASSAFPPLIYFIHLFRMPTFFAITGFFAALLYERDGATRFIRNRTKRVLLPLIVFWALTGPLVLAGFYFAITHGGRISGPELMAKAAPGLRLSQLSLVHLWFLWYLVLFYAAALGVLGVAGRRRVSLEDAARLTTGPWSLPLWTAMTTLTLLPMPHPGLEASPLLLPDPRSLAAYGVFFAFGWLLFHGRHRLDTLSERWSLKPLLSLLAMVIAWQLTVYAAGPGSPVLHVADRVAVAFVIWVLVLAAIGCFIRFARRENARMRYLSDASYWIYLVHLPVVIWSAAMMARIPAFAFVKFAIVLAVTTAVCIGTYHGFVRRTFIGEFLNGRKFAA